MRLLGFFLLALALAVGIGQFLSHDPGLVTVTRNGTSVRMSLAIALVLALLAGVVAYGVLWMVWRALNARNRFRQWRAARARDRNHTRLSDGLLALAAGEYVQAERLLAGARGPQATAAHYLAAAQAAHAQQATGRRDRYLARAREVAPAHAFPLALQQVEMQLDSGELPAADSALRALEETRGGRTQVLALRHRYLTAAQAWDDIAALLPRLKRAGVYPAARLVELEAECAARILGRPYADRDSLTQAWERLPRSVRTEPAVVAAFARVLLGQNAQAIAEAILRKTLTTHWEPRLVSLYGELQGPVAREALRHAERWLAERSEDAGLLLTLPIASDPP